MTSQIRYIKRFAKPDPRACTQQAFEKVLNHKYSAMTLEEVVAEFGYLTERDRSELSGQYANLIRSYKLGRLAHILNKHVKPKFMLLYRDL